MRRFALICLFLGLFFTFSAPAQDLVPYRTSFEEPDFVVGDLDGQSGWTNKSGTGAGAIQDSTPGGVRRGDQSLLVQPAAIVSRNFSATEENVIFIDGFYRGPTIDFVPDATSIPELGSSLVLFHETLGILALDGDGSGGGDWLESGFPIATEGLQRITIRQDYGSKTWDLFVNREQRLAGLGFKDDSIASLSGIDIETSAGGQGFLDDFAVTLSPPEFFVGPALFAFQGEWTRSGEHLEYDLSPPSSDGTVNSNDLVEVIDQIQNPDSD